MSGTESQQSEAVVDESDVAVDASEEPTSIEQQLEAAVAESDANRERWLRAQADLENYRRRVQREMEEDRLYRSLPLVRDLLPGLDNLQRAIDAAGSAAKSPQDGDDLAAGVKMVAKQFEDVLAAHSVQAIEAVGHAFDPNLHEAVQQIPSKEHPPLTVIEEVERGYRLHERVVRPSKVIVSSGPPAGAARNT